LTAVVLKREKGVREKGRTPKVLKDLRLEEHVRSLGNNVVYYCKAN